MPWASSRRLASASSAAWSASASRAARPGSGRRSACAPRQAERVAQGYQALLRAVMQVALQVGPRGIGRFDGQPPRRAEGR